MIRLVALYVVAVPAGIAFGWLLDRRRQNRVYHAWVNRCWRCLWRPYHS